MLPPPPSPPQMVVVNPAVVPAIESFLDASPPQLLSCTLLALDALFGAVDGPFHAYEGNSMGVGGLGSLGGGMAELPSAAALAARLKSMMGGKGASLKGIFGSFGFMSRLGTPAATPLFGATPGAATPNKPMQPGAGATSAAAANAGPAAAPRPSASSSVSDLRASLAAALGHAPRHGSAALPRITAPAAPEAGAASPSPSTSAAPSRSGHPHGAATPTASRYCGSVPAGDRHAAAVVQLWPAGTAPPSDLASWANARAWLSLPSVWEGLASVVLQRDPMALRALMLRVVTSRDLAPRGTLQLLDVGVRCVLCVVI
jgi:hypothetical protein